VVNNIVASTWHAGFILPAYNCEGTQVHSGNVAHSISGYGVIVQRPSIMEHISNGEEYGSNGYKWIPETGNCFEFSDFKGYKTQSALVNIGDDLGAHTSKVRDIVAIDASTGLKAFLS
jgi:hypothetical protein